MRFIPILVLTFLVMSCGKDSFTTKPQLKFKSVSANTVSGNQTLTIKLDLSDKEGDFTSLLGMKKTVAGCSTSNFIDSATFVIPDEFINTKGKHGEVDVILDRIKRGSNSCFLPGGAIRPDTTVFRFWTRDKAGNVSDTTLSETIIILN
jgi:hypothetical protein